MKTMKKTIKVGVVGCGYWGPNLIRNFRQASDCQLAVLCDTSEQRLKHMRRLYPEVATTNRYEDLLKDPSLEAGTVELILGSDYSGTLATPGGTSPGSGKKSVNGLSKTFGGIRGNAACKSDTGAFAGPNSPAIP